MGCSLLIVSRDPITRCGLRVLLQDRGESHTIAEARTVEEAIKIASVSGPEVALVEADPRVLGGLRRFSESLPQTKIVVFSRSDDPEALQRGLDAGARGFVVCEGEDLTQLFESLERVCRGQYAVCTVSLEHLVAAYRRYGCQPIDCPLTLRETEVLRLAADGATTEQIAATLYLSAATVKSYLRQIYSKLGVSSRGAAIAKFLQWSDRHPEKVGANAPRESGERADIASSNQPDIQRLPALQLRGRRPPVATVGIARPTRSKVMRSA